ncbi:MAG: hypothetical protein HC860_18185 [Alkalinema sp. RU_4_3]|nr:hypothetical protein [Alkalinema sp. RU_4_3]
MFQQRTRQIVRVDYGASRNGKTLTVLLQDGHVMRLQGRLGLSNGRQVFVIESGSFTQNKGAAMGGKLYVTVKNGRLLALSGSVFSENQSILLTYSPETDATYPGRGTFEFRGETTAIDSAIYTDGQGTSRVLKLNLRDGQVMKLQGFLINADDITFNVVKGEFLSGKPKKKGSADANISGALEVRRRNGHLRSVEGQLKFDGQAIGVRFASGS